MENRDFDYAFSVKPGEVISVNGGHDWLTVWSIALLKNGRNVGIRFVERDAAGHRYYVNLRTDNEVLIRP